MKRIDWVALGSVVVVATLLRLPGIDARGQFDADQAHDMLTLVAWTRDGIVPLLGPRASVGTFHHGAFYYFLLAPVAALSHVDPVTITAFLALLGIATVALTWWLAREIGGSTAGAFAGLLLAVSPAAITESTFIWNPSPIAFFAILAFAAAWRARSGGSRWWWAIALGAAGAVVQLHLLGVVFFVAILAIVVAELRRERSIVIPLIAGLAIVGVLFLPLLVHELQTGFLETQRFLEYLRGPDEPLPSNPLITIGIPLLRIVGWPLIGLVTEAPSAAIVVLLITLVCAVLAWRIVPPPRRTAITWLIGTLVWATPALAYAAPSLQVVVVGLPNDHYHAFLDPVVVLLVTIPLAMLLERSFVAWRSAGSDGPTRNPRPLLVGGPAAVVLGAVLTMAVLRMPPSTDPNGGWPAMRDAGARVVAQSAGEPMHLIGLPMIKVSDAVRFPIEHAGGSVVDGYAIARDPATVTGRIVISCDRLFEVALGSPCGGPAEDAAARAWAAGSPITLQLVDRFDASPRTAISVYRPVFP